METFFIKKIREVKKLKSDIEKKLEIELKILGNKVVIRGNPVNEYDALRIFEAIAFGFPVKKAFLLKESDASFRALHIKDYSKRNLKDINSRLIGKQGKTKKTIAEISNCHILVRDGEVGIIGYSEDVESASTAIIHLIKGSKQSNMYKYLERMNRAKKEMTDLGLKEI